VKLSALAQSGREPPLPLAVALDAGRTPLEIQSWLRVLPAQRYVGKALWQGKAVLAKLFVGRKAARHWRAERQGALLLESSPLPTPKLLASGEITGQGAWLLFDWLEGSQSLLQCWEALEHEALLSGAQQSLLQQALQALGKLHAHGLWQDDLHLDNLLYAQGNIWLIDGGGVRVQTLGKPLASKRALDNLALFFAQLPLSLSAFARQLLPFYQQENPAARLQEAALHKVVQQWRNKRLSTYLKKITRDCSEFAVQRSSSQLCVIRREDEAQLQPLMAELDTQIENGQRYKQGGSASVSRIDWQGRALVAKRYNLKSRWHWLRRCLRESRALHSWREGHRLQMLGMATARPLALLEKRYLGLRSTAYLLCEHCAGVDLLACLSPYLHSAPPEKYIKALEQLLASLITARISHGDLKGHNLLWQGDKWLLIDLDAMRQHRCGRRFARAFTRDRGRLLRNFPEDSPLYLLLDKRLPNLPR